MEHAYKKGKLEKEKERKRGGAHVRFGSFQLLDSGKEGVGGLSKAGPGMQHLGVLFQSQPQLGAFLSALAQDRCTSVHPQLPLCSKEHKEDVQLFRTKQP